MSIVKICRSLVAKGKTEEALNELEGLYPYKAAELLGRLNNSTKLFREEKVTLDQHRVSLNKLNANVLSLLSQIEEGTFTDTLPKAQHTQIVTIPCWTCGMKKAERFESIQVETFGKEGEDWKLSGKIHLKYCKHDRCCNCGQMLEDIEQSIPIQYPSLSCPTCKESQFLRCNIQHVTLAEEGDHFEFEASFECKHGHLFHRLKKKLSQFLSIRTIDVTPEAIELAT